jgi:hypothetical protein
MIKEISFQLTTLLWKQLEKDFGFGFCSQFRQKLKILRNQSLIFLPKRKTVIG